VVEHSSLNTKARLLKKDIVGALSEVVGTGGFGLSVLFSRPSYVNWAARYAQLRAAALRAPNRVRPELIAHIRRLEEMARNNPDLLPVVRAAREDGIIQGNEDDQR